MSPRPARLLTLLLAIAACSGRSRARDSLLRESLHIGNAASPSRRLRRMTESPHAYLRGSLEVFARDWTRDEAGLRASRYATSRMVFSVGDAHVENFGTLVGAGGDARFEVNDLDQAAPAPMRWDLRRLAVSLRLAVLRDHSPHDGDALALALARGYARGLAAPEEALAAAPRSPLVADLLRRAARDRDERADDGEERGAPLSPAALAAAQERLSQCRAAMAAPRDAAFFTVVDAREASGGVSSADATRVALRVRGPGDDPADDLSLELKPLLPPVTPWPAAGDARSRIRLARERLWTRPDADPSWCAWDAPTGAWQARGAAPGTLSLRARRVAQASPAEAVDLADALGALLAALHRRSLAATDPAITAITRDPDGFAEEQRAVSARYAAVAVDDWTRLRRMLRAGR